MHTSKQSETQSFHAFTHTYIQKETLTQSFHAFK